MDERDIDIRSLPPEFELQPGFHPDPESGMCALEAVSWLAGLPHSDQPDCVCPVLAVLLRSVNDRMTHFHRQGLIPYLPRVVNSRSLALAEPRARSLAWRALTLFAPIPLAARRLLEPAGTMAQLSRHDVEGALEAAVDIEKTVNALAWAEAEANGAKIWNNDVKVEAATWASVEVARLARTTMSLLIEEAEAPELATSAAQIIAATCRFDRDAWPLALDTLGHLLDLGQSDATVVKLDEFRAARHQAA